MTLLGALREAHTDILAINESLRRAIEAARRARRTAERDSKAPPGKQVPFVGTPPWAQNPNFEITVPGGGGV